MNTNRTCTAILTLALLAFATASGTQARAESGPSEKAVRRAHEFLKGESTGRYVLGFVHMGARYDGHELVELVGVKRNGRPVPGHFALVYGYDWQGDGSTRIAFLCDREGSVYEMQVLDHNGVLNRPFDLAKLSIAVLGEALLEAFREQMTDSDQALLRRIVRDADPKSLLELGLTFRQAISK